MLQAEYAGRGLRERGNRVGERNADVIDSAAKRRVLGEGRPGDRSCSRQPGDAARDCHRKTAEDVCAVLGCCRSHRVGHQRDPPRREIEEHSHHGGVKVVTVQNCLQRDSWR